MNWRVGGTLAIIDQQQGCIREMEYCTAWSSKEPRPTPEGPSNVTYGVNVTLCHIQASTGRPGNAQITLTDSYPTILVADDSTPTSDIVDWYAKVRYHYGLHLH